MNIIKQCLRWENDDFWWEKLQFGELGLPDWVTNIIPPLPDKLQHLLLTFYLCYAFYALTKSRLWGTLIGWLLMMVAWEVVWDGCFRHGVSWKDMIFNTIGAALCCWWLGNKKIGQTDGENLP